MSENNNLPQKKDSAEVALQKTTSLLSITNKILANRAAHNNIDAVNFGINWTLLFEHKDFFNQLFSTYYKFNEIELINLNGKLSIGSPCTFTSSFYRDSSEPIFGLIYNKEIFWTDFLKKIYYKEPELIHVDDMADWYSYEINFDELPLSLLEEIEDNKSFAERRVFDCFSGSGLDDEDCDSLQKQIEYIDEYYNALISKSSFNSNELIDIIKSNKNEYICNKYIYSQLLKKIHSNIPNFSINKFYDKF